MHLIYFASPGLPDPATIKKYEMALAPLEPFELKWIAKPGFSAVFIQEAQRLRRNGRVVPGLLDTYQPSRPHSTLSLIGFSAGCWFGREALRNDEDQNAIDAFVALDGVHDDLGIISVDDHELGPYVRYADRAKRGLGLFWLGHTDVPTYGYRSTTDTAAALLRLTGGAGGNWYVRPHDLFPAAKAKAEHGAALTTWGPSFVAEALVPHLTKLGKSIPPPDGRPWHDDSLSLGERAVAWSVKEMARGRLETAGVNAGPVITEYFAPAMRNINGVERPLGIRSGNWCVVGACAAERASLLAGEKATLPYRASGIELQKDAAAAGVWRPAELMRAGKWSPTRGDLVVLKRGTGWERHVCRVYKNVDGYGAYQTIDANHGDRWAIVDRKIHAPELLGFCELPRLVQTVTADFNMFLDPVVAGVKAIEHALRSLVGGVG